MEVDNECKMDDKSPFKRAVHNTAPINSNTGLDLVICFYCENISEELNFYDWIGDQSMSKNHKCECGQVSAVKIFIRSELERTNNSPAKLSTKYVHYLANTNKLKQGKGPLCECSGPLFVRVIAQNEFIIRERIICTYCKKINRVEFRCDTIKPMAKKQVEGPWTPAVRVRHTKKQLAEENQLKHDESRGIKNIAARDAQRASYDKPKSSPGLQSAGARVQSKTAEAGIFTSNSFSLLSPTEEDQGSESDDTVSVWSENGAAKRRRVRKPHLPPISTALLHPSTNGAVLSGDVNSATPETYKKSESEARTKRYPPFICEYDAWITDKNEWKKANEIARTTNCVIRADPKSKKIIYTPKNKEAHEAIQKWLNNDHSKYNYYTYGCKDDRRPAKKLIAKGIRAEGYTEEEIKADILTRYGIKTERVITMKNSALILIFPGETDMRVARDIKFILSQRATIEKYKIRDSAVTQCKRCWQFGHVQSHCHRIEQPDAIEQHEDGEVWRACYNCQEIGHTARQAKCPLFQLEITKQKDRRQAFAKNNKQSKQQPTKQATPAVDAPKSTWATRTEGISYVTVAGASSGPQTTHKFSVKKAEGKASPDLLCKAKELMKSLQAKGYSTETILDFVLELING